LTPGPAGAEVAFRQPAFDIRQGCGKHSPDKQDGRSHGRLHRETALDAKTIAPAGPGVKFTANQRVGSG
jgi:hypothetical protein